MSLLMKAKQIQNRRRLTEKPLNREELELAIAMAKGDVGPNQVMEVMKFKNTSQVYTWAYSIMAKALRQNIVLR